MFGVKIWGADFFGGQTFKGSYCFQKYLFVCFTIAAEVSMAKRLKKKICYEQVSVSSGIGRTEGPKCEMPLKW